MTEGLHSDERATSVCEVGDCREPAFCLVGIGLSGSMLVCETHAASAERMGFATGFNRLTIAAGATERMA